MGQQSLFVSSIFIRKKFTLQPIFQYIIWIDKSTRLHTSVCYHRYNRVSSMPLSEFINCRNPKSRIVTEHNYNTRIPAMWSFALATAICTNREFERCCLIQCSKVQSRTVASFAHQNNRYVNNIWDYTRKWPRNFKYRPCQTKDSNNCSYSEHQYSQSWIRVNENIFKYCYIK